MREQKTIVNTVRDKMKDVNWEEGEKCPDEKCSGYLNFQEPENCSCHINPPCSACMSAELECNVCGIKESDHG